MLPQSRIAGAIHLAHTASAEEILQKVRAEPSPCGECARRSPFRFEWHDLRDGRAEADYTCTLLTSCVGFVDENLLALVLVAIGTAHDWKSVFVNDVAEMFTVGKNRCFWRWGQ
jgi:hypothetical protein